MIIKFKHDNTWVVFGEVNHVEYCYMDGKEPIAEKALVYGSEVNQPDCKQVGMGFFTKNMDEPTQIVAYSPIYLMNDQGKTIETI